MPHLLPPCVGNLTFYRFGLLAQLDLLFQHFRGTVWVCERSLWLYVEVFVIEPLCKISSFSSVGTTSLREPCVSS